MFPPGVLPENLSLLPHQKARDKVVSTRCLPAGTIILSDQSLTTTLLPKEKGRRCDFCHSFAPQDQGHLRRCSGCASYWYCDSKCTHHPSEALNASTNDQSISPSRSIVAWAYTQEILQEHQCVLCVAAIQPTRISRKDGHNSAHPLARRMLGQRDRNGGR
jgi:hypothetical protein